MLLFNVLYSFCSIEFYDIIKSQFNDNNLDNIRITTTLACAMDFKLYPFGSQKCKLELASYAWPDKDVLYVWRNKNPISIGMHKSGFVSLRTPSQYAWNMKTPKTDIDRVSTSTGA